MILKPRIQFVHCHRKPERSFFWKGKQFPVCARCTGIYISYLSFFLFNFEIIKLPTWIAILMILPTLIDGLSQVYFKRESTNSIRVVTGFIAGVGGMAIVVNIGTFIGNLIL